MVVMPGRRNWKDLLLRARKLALRRSSRAGGWLVLAPHPDDETLGAGGLVAALASSGRTVTVAFLTDGAGSHIGAPGWSASRVAALRAREAGAALRTLGLHQPAVSLDWPDAAPFAEGTPQFEAAVRRLVTLCRARHIRHLATTWEHEPHCDHAAAARLVIKASRRLRITPKFYLVWGWTLPDLGRLLRPWRAEAVPVAECRGRQRRALQCHRSQFGCRIAGARERFVLPRAMRRLVDVTHVLLLETRHAP